MIAFHHASTSPTKPAAVLALLLAAAIAASLAGCASSAKPAPGAAPPVAQPAGAGKAAAEDPKVQGLEKASALLKDGKTDEAAASIQALSAADPSSAELRLVHAAALVSGGKLAEARAEVSSVLEADPRNIKALSMAVELARFAGDEKSRKEYLDAAIAVAPGDSGVLAAWGQLNLDLKNWPVAEGFYRRSKAADPANPDAALGLGRALYREAKYAEAEAELNAAISLAPDEAMAYSDRSRARYQLGRYDESAADLDIAITKAPDSPWLYLDRGRLRLDSGKKAEAELDFSKSIDLDPGYFLPFVFRGGIREEAGRDEEALADYRMIIVLNPDYWYAFESAASVAFRLGKWSESAVDFGKAFGFAKDRYEYAIAAAIASWRDGKPREASALAAKIAPTIDRDKNGIYWLMLRLIQDQNDSSAELELKIQGEKGLDLRSAMLFYLGEYWLCRGKTELASRYFLLSKDLHRESSLEYRLLAAELKRMELAKAHG